MNDFMELRRVTTIVLRRWWLLVLLIVMGALVGYAISRAQTPVYQATATILVGESIRSSNVDRVDIQISEALIQTYVEIARRQPVLQGVVATLNLNKSWQELSRQVTVRPIESTQIIEIITEADSPELARRIADEIVNQLILLSPSSSESAENQLNSSFNREQMASLQERIVSGQRRLAEIDTAINNSISESELTALQQERANLEGLMIEWERNYTQLLALTEPGRDPTQLSIVEPAHSNNRMVRPRVQLNTILGAGVGLVLALGLIFLLDFLDDTFKSLKDFSQSEEVSILGSVRRIRGRKPSDKVVARLQPHSPITESYRLIRSRIRFKRGDNPAQAIMVTSSMPREGKSLTAANLAVVFAQADFKTVVVDGDLRNPLLHELFNVENDVGLGDVLSSDVMQVEDCLKETPVDNLRILTSGKALADPSWQLGSERMEEIITNLKKIADFVIFDSPPALVFADATALSRRMDGVIVVIQAGKTKRRAIEQTLLDLQNANAKLLGSIFNQSPRSDTFSVNKVYMQERPKPAFARGLAKKEDQFHDLRASATPLSENLAESELESGKTEAVATDVHDSDDLAASVRENAGIDEDRSLGLSDSSAPAREGHEIFVSGNGLKPIETDVVHETDAAASTNYTEPAELSDIQDLTASADDGLETADLGDPSMPPSENQEVSGSDSAEVAPAVDETEFHDLEDETHIHEPEDSAIPESESLGSNSESNEAEVEKNGIHEHSKRKRRRKARHSELKSEPVSVSSPSDPIEPTTE
ncbi:MAG TPA: polysaccharide biosynthesis tyrosine autokinase [Anaerolineales bacterium]